MDLLKEIKALETSIENLQEDIENLKNFYNLSLVEKIKVAKRVDLRAQRKAFAKVIRDDLKSDVLKKYGTIYVGVNNVIVEFNNRIIKIPLYRSKYIKLAYKDGHIPYRKRKLYNLDELYEKKMELEKQLDSFSKIKTFFKRNKKRDIEKTLASVSYEIAWKEPINEDVEINNVFYEKQLEEDMEFLKNIAKDIKVFLDDGYKITFSGAGETKLSLFYNDCFRGLQEKEMDEVLRNVLDDSICNH